MQHLFSESPLVLIDGIHYLDCPPTELLCQLHQKQPLIESINLIPDVLRSLLHLLLDYLPIPRVVIVVLDWRYLVMRVEQIRSQHIVRVYVYPKYRCLIMSTILKLLGVLDSRETLVLS